MYKLYYIIALNFLALAAYAQEPFWEIVEIPESIKRLGSIAINDSGHLFLGASPYDGKGGGVYRYKGDGYEWEHLGLGKSFICSMAISQSNDIFLGTNCWVIRSTDNGATWDTLKEMLTNFDDIEVTEDSMVFATTYYGLLRSFNYGDNWNLVFNDQIGDAWMSSVEVGPSKELYIGLRDYYDPIRGVFRSLDTGNTWEYIGPDKPIHSVETKKYVSVTCYPNPFISGSTIRINYQMGEIPAESQLKLINSAGKLVKKIHLKNTNRYYLKGNIPAGIYYVIIESGNYKGYHKIIKIN